jgi:hypothetical protein
MGTGEQIRAFDDLIDILAYFDPEIGVPAREGILLIKELIEAGAEDPAAAVRELRARIRSDWRAALAAKFPEGGHVPPVPT